MISRSLLIFLLCCAGCFVLYLVWSSNGVSQKLETANSAYQVAITAKTIDERKTAFNEALKLYSELELSQEPIFGNGKLYSNIGNIYYELESYPWALLYYYRAQKLDLFNQDIEQNIRKTRKVLKLPEINEYSVLHQLFFIHHKLSLPQRLQLFFLVGLVAVLLGSLAIWLPKKTVRGTAAFSGIVCFLLLVSCLYTRYFEPMRAVLIEASLLSREVGVPNDWVTQVPTSSGTQLIVLDIFQEGAWLKVMAPDGTLGYITADRIRII